MKLLYDLFLNPEDITFDLLDDFVAQFYDCTLKVDLPPFEAGSIIDVVVVDLVGNTVELYKNSEKVSEYDLELSLL